MLADHRVEGAAIEHQTVVKIWWRTVPLLALLMFCCSLDRINLSFAALTMNEELGFSNTTFGLGVGFFAVGYAVFAIPSTLALHRFGARRWMSLIAIVWAVCSASTALVTNAGQLLAVRFLLGAAESGFAPGVVLYFSYWFPSQYRGRVLGSWMVIGPLALIVGGPVSGALLSLDNPLGLAGWQWLFIVEALPSVLLGLIALWPRFLADRPAEASWLSADEKRWLERKFKQEEPRGTEPRASRVNWQAVTRSRVWVLALVYLALGTSGLGASLFVPLIIRSTGFSVAGSGWMSAVPGLAAAVTLPLWGLWSDRIRRRELVVATGCAGIAAGLIGAALLLPSPLAIIPICVAMAGFNGALVAFWTLPSSFLAGASAAAGIALINLTGNFGMLTGPLLVGRLSDLTHSYVMGVASLGGIAAAAAALIAAPAAHESIRNRKVWRWSL